MWIQIVYSTCKNKKNAYIDIADDVEKRFHTSNYYVDRPLPIEKNEKVTRVMKDEIYGKIMAKHVGLKPKVNGKRYKEDYKNCLKMMLKS